MNIGGLRRLATTKILVALGLLIGTACQVFGVPLHTGLISYWALDDGLGMTALDSGPDGSSIDSGMLRNDPVWVNGKFGAGLQFNGTNDVLLPSGGDMDINANAVTLSAWVKLDQLPAEIAGSFAGILDSAPDNYVMYLDKGNDELRFKATNASAVSTVTAQHPGIRASQLNTTDWLHVMGVYDGDRARVKIYFNGQLADVTSQANPVSQLLTGPVRTGQVGGIGSQPAADDPHNPTNLFQGMISDVALWNRALGGAEAQYLYNNGAGHAVGEANPDIAPLPPITAMQPSAQPVIYYKFDGNLNNSGTGGAAYNATLQDVPGRNDSLYTPTSFGQGLDLRQNPVSTSSINEGGDYLSVDYTLADSGTIATRFTAVELANFVTLWSNSSHENDWEGWVYGDGRVAARANRDTAILANNLFLQSDPTASHHYAFTWQRDEANPASMLVRMYVNGEFVDERLGVWRDPGSTFFIAGGTGPAAGNHLGTGVFDEFRIYNSALSEAEVLYLSMFAPDTVDLEGDFNLDGSVDAADYVVWRDTMGDDASYNIWRANFGQPGSGVGAGGAVPELATTGLAATMLLVLGASARGVRRKSLI